MSVHTDKPSEPCGTGYVALRDYFTLWMEQMEGFSERRFTDLDKAVNKAEAGLERRLDLLNEFRAQAADEAKKYALRDTVETLSTQISRLYGGILVVGAIGVANLVKLWFAH